MLNGDTLILSFFGIRQINGVITYPCFYFEDEDDVLFNASFDEGDIQQCGFVSALLLFFPFQLMNCTATGLTELTE